MSHLHPLQKTGDSIVILSNRRWACLLFAAILRGCSDTLGVAPVGVSHALLAERTTRVAIVLGLSSPYHGCRRPLTLRGLTGGIALTMIFWPLWAAAQDYLFLFSIQPSFWP